MSDKYEFGDEIMLGPDLPCGGRIGIRHDADHNTTPCVVRPLEHGKPIMGDEVACFDHIEGNRYRVTAICDGIGPAKVTSDSYRDGWDRLFGNETN